MIIGFAFLSRRRIFISPLRVDLLELFLDNERDMSIYEKDVSPSGMVSPVFIGEYGTGVSRLAQPGPQDVVFPASFRDEAILCSIFTPPQLL